MTVQSCPDLVRGGAVNDDCLDLFRDRTEKPGLDDLVCLKPEFVVWIRNSRVDAIDARNREGFSRLCLSACDKPKQLLTVKESFELTFPEEVVVVCEFDGNRVNKSQRGWLIHSDGVGHGSDTM